MRNSLFIITKEDTHLRRSRHNSGDAITMQQRERGAGITLSQGVGLGCSGTLAFGERLKLANPGISICISIQIQYCPYHPSSILILTLNLTIVQFLSVSSVYNSFSGI